MRNYWLTVQQLRIDSNRHTAKKSEPCKAAFCWWLWSCAPARPDSSRISSLTVSCRSSFSLSAENGASSGVVALEPSTMPILLGWLGYTLYWRWLTLKMTVSLKMVLKMAENSAREHSVWGVLKKMCLRSEGNFLNNKAIIFVIIESLGIEVG